MLRNGLDEKGIFEWDGRGHGASGVHLEEAGAGRGGLCSEPGAGELGAVGEGARGEPCGGHKSRQVPAAQRKVVDFILSKVEPQEGLSWEEQDPSGCWVVKGEVVRGAGVGVPGAAVQVGGGGRVPELPGGRRVRSGPGA